VVIQIDRTGVMLPIPGTKPVAADQVLVRVEVSEKPVGDGDLPGIVLQFVPALDDLGALDDDFLAFGGLVKDAFVIGRPAARRIDSFAIGPLMDDYHVARLCSLRCRRYSPQGL